MAQKTGFHLHQFYQKLTTESILNLCWSQDVKTWLVSDSVQGAIFFLKLYPWHVTNRGLSLGTALQLFRCHPYTLYFSKFIESSPLWRHIADGRCGTRIYEMQKQFLRYHRPSPTRHIRPALYSTTHRRTQQ